MPEIRDAVNEPYILEHPNCTKCGGAMVLARIEPETPGVECRTFECRNCQTSQAFLVKFR